MSADVFSFGPFRLRPRERALYEGNEPVRLGSRAFDILLALVERAGSTVSKEELIATVWSDTTVDESNLRVHVAALRKALGEGRGGRRYIMNVPSRGYGFVATVTRSSDDGGASPATETHVHGAASHDDDLPMPLSRLVGRDAVVRTVEEQVRARRFVSVVGGAGMGKTSVALAAAARLAPAFPHGVRFVDLASLEDASLVPNVLASKLGISLPAVAPLPFLAQVLADRSMLLVLDNCEHVIAEAAHFAEAVLSSAPEISILATSREPLRALGEWVLRIAPLALPESSTTLSAATALGYPAIELFVERAATALDGFVLTDADAHVVAEICRRLDGIPLAIELAAANVPALGVAGLASRLDDRFRLLMSGRRTALLRQQTLRGALDWSHESLSGEQQRVLRRLSVFQGGFPLDGALGVAADDDEGREVLDDLSQLVAKSLVIADVSVDPVQYRLFGTTRAYAFEKLGLAGEVETTRRRHARHVLSWLERFGQARARLPLAEWRSAIVAFIDDVRAALKWGFADGGDLALAIDIVLAAVPLVNDLSLHAEFERNVSLALARLADLPSVSPSVETRLTFAWAATTTHARGTMDRENVRRAEALAEEGSDPSTRPHAIEALWSEAFASGDYPRASSLAEEHERATANLADLDVKLHSQRILGISAHFAGHEVAARMHLTRAVGRPGDDAVPRYPETVVIERATSARIHLARVLWLQGEVDEAMSLTRGVVDRWTAKAHHVTICYALAFAAIPLAIWRGEIDQAKAWAERLVEDSGRRGLGLWQGWGHCFGAYLGAPWAPAVPTNEAFRASQRDTLSTFREQLLHPETVERVERGIVGWCAPEIFRAMGENLLRERGETAFAEAEVLFARSLVRAREEGALSWELRTATSLAKLWSARERRSEARAALAPVLERFTQGRTTHDVVAARIVLDAL